MEQVVQEAPHTPAVPVIHQLDEVPTVQVVFRDLNYTVQVGSGRKKKDKAILKDVSGVFQPGRFTAILGASGAGKTSLLNVLAGRAQGGKVNGDILINGEKATMSTMRRISAFVFQDDVILDTMTVREALVMSARLRLPRKMSHKDKMARVNEIIEEMQLEKCADTLIGSSLIKGVSGGERKRCALGMEMMSHPSVLFCDEPTSGLDSFTALHVVQVLKDLAQRGRTVVATLHQPSSEIFHMFDELLILSEGRIMYMGESEHSMDYFARVGFPCPKYTNPADYFFMKILNTLPADIRFASAPPPEEGAAASSHTSHGESHLSLARSLVHRLSSSKVEEPFDDIQCSHPPHENGSSHVPHENGSSHAPHTNGSHPPAQAQAEHHSVAHSIIRKISASRGMDSEQDPATAAHRQQHLEELKQTEQDAKQMKEAAQKRIEGLLDVWPSTEEAAVVRKAVDNPTQGGVKRDRSDKHAGFFTQMSVLCQRSFKNNMRNKLALQAKIGQTLFMTIIIGLIFLHIQNNQIGAYNRQGALFFLAIQLMLSSTFGILSVFGAEKPVFAREYMAGLYDTASFFVSKVLVELPTNIFNPLLFVSICYWMIGFQPSAEKFFIFATFAILLDNCGAAWGIWIASVFPSLELAVAIAPLFVLPLVLFSGFFVTNDGIPPYFDWIKYISPMKWAFSGFSQTEFGGLTFDTSDCKPNTQCYAVGQDVLVSLGLASDPSIGVMMLIMVGLWAGLILMAYLFLLRVVRSRYAA
mmetsp:Transcript_26825/g.43807  ORF Transcript_26825/g.43807 Transcript_26825/m.43807 type:complete len:755 (+) Transcript_26825:191-2455(+)|eukprot:CAMPEP_0184658730 /NCGR_PEP_ID=MMETSP0308-20130426/26685_1 /TAXON_ID=38269 /ORGANISM="Gloeochaete witrockiana, Strain SAG 46.84" /LENGTH=754 /DNA_ID=CAMNT_0027097947 /DNA_START=94 /DNA_END=2358 /DNA_ORIENTATION=+